MEISQSIEKSEQTRVDSIVKKGDAIVLRDRIKLLMEAILQDGITNQLSLFIQTSQFDQHQLYQFKPVMDLIISLSISIQAAIKEMITNLDYIDTVEYYSLLLSGITNGIESVCILYPIDSMLFQLQKFKRLVPVKNFDLLHFVVSEIQLFLSRHDRSNGKMKNEVKRGGKKKKKKVDKLVKRNKIIPSIDSFMVKPTYKSGKSVVNKWRKFNHDKSWTIGFSRQKLFKNLVVPKR